MNKTLYLLDGHSLIFRMYYAFLRRPMVNSKGQDTSILFGFTKYLLELIEKEQPSHIAVAFDPAGGTFRNQLYPQYKANRAETPQLVVDALNPLIEILGALKIPVLMVQGYEADDVIGTAAKSAETEGFQVYMVTPDKDYGQLITPKILQYKPGKAGGEREIFGPREVCEKYGIQSPMQVIDILTICGDSSDNVPGVKGVGEVGASKLISKYGSVPDIYEHISELTEKQKTAFEDSLDHIYLSRDLITIRTNVPVDLDFKAMELASSYDPHIAELFNFYEFGSLKKHIVNLDAVSGAPKVEVPVFEQKTVDPTTIIKHARAQKRFAIVCEASGDSIFSSIKHIYIGVATAKGYFAAEGGLGDFDQIIEDPTIEKCGYDLKRQLNLLKASGVALEGRLVDIELMHYLIDPERSHRLDILAPTYLGVDVELPQEDKTGQMLSLFDEPAEDDDEAKKTALKLREAAITAALAIKVEEQFFALPIAGLYDELEEPLLKVLAQIEWEGVRVDLNQLRQIAAHLSQELDQIQARVREMADEPELNIMSTKQIGTVIFEKLALDPKVKKPKDGKRYNYSTDEETLSALADRHPIIGEILEDRGGRKLLSTYLEPLHNFVAPQTGKIHTTFNQALTATGRLSSSKPNLQNIPVRTERGKEIRKAFVSSLPNGVILSADYSQIELRLMAHFSGDEHMVAAFRDGTDVHAATASKIFRVSPSDVTPEMRRIAKTANFGIIYGISAFGLSQRLKIGRGEAKRIIDDYFAAFPTVRTYIENTVALVRERGYAQTLFGRRRYLPDINSSNVNVRSLAERNAVNAPIQGSAADIIKKAMIGVAQRMRKEGIRSKMVLQIHDELVFDAYPEEVEKLRAIVVEEMENVVKLSIPLTVDCNYGNNWLEAH